MKKMKEIEEFSEEKKDIKKFLEGEPKPLSEIFKEVFKNDYYKIKNIADWCEGRHSYLDYNYSISKELKDEIQKRIKNTLKISLEEDIELLYKNSNPTGQSMSPIISPNTLYYFIAKNYRKKFLITELFITDRGLLKNVTEYPEWLFSKDLIKYPVKVINGRIVITKKEMVKIQEMFPQGKVIIIRKNNKYFATECLYDKEEINNLLNKIGYEYVKKIVPFIALERYNNYCPSDEEVEADIKEDFFWEIKEKYNGSYYIF